MGMTWTWINPIKLKILLSKTFINHKYFLMYSPICLSFDFFPDRAVIIGSHGRLNWPDVVSILPKSQLPNVAPASGKEQVDANESDWVSEDEYVVEYR